MREHSTRNKGIRYLTILPQRFSNTPIYYETLREAMVEKVDLNALKEIFQSISEGIIEVEIHLSQEKPTPYAYRILNKFLEVPEMMAPESVRKDILTRMKMAVMATHVELFGVNCGEWIDAFKVDEVLDKLKCLQCGSGLIAVFRYPRSYAEKCVKKRLKG